MSVETRSEVQTSEILQDTMPATSTMDSDGDTLQHGSSPFTLSKVYRWLVGISKAVLGEKTRRNNAKRIQGLDQTLTGTITSSGTTVTGSGTLFLSELFSGAFIAGTANEYREVLSIASDTSLTLSAAFSVDIAVAQSYTRLQSLAERVDGIEEYVNQCINGELDSWVNTSLSTPASNTEAAENFFVNYDGTIGTFAVSRESFTLGQTDVPGEPQYYLRWNHTSAGSAQTIKRIRHRISGVRTFAGQTIQITFYAKFASAAAVTVGATQYFGTGGSPSSDVTVTAKSRTLTTTFARYTVTLAIPSISGKTIGSNANDALFINFNLPLNATCDFQIANIAVYKGTAELPFKITLPLTKIKNAIFNGINGLTSKSTPVGADVIVIGDSAASFAGKKVPISSLPLAAVPQATWRANTYTGYGSTNTRIPYFTTVVENVDTAAALTVSNSATNGLSITINTPGKYSISFSANFSSASTMGLSLNSSQLTTNIVSITAANRLGLTDTAGAGFGSSISVTKYFAANDVIRPHTNGVAANTAASWDFIIERVG